MSPSCRRCWLIAAAAACALTGAQAAIVEPMEQSFYFDYFRSTDLEPAPVPVTKQCEAINIKWRREPATGPSATAPYFLQIYSSYYIFPFIVDAGSGSSFDFEIPFPPSTLYQICMFDSKGYSGGCQAVYSVIPSDDEKLSCSNSTLSFPDGPLDVDAQAHDGPLSQYGWPAQCTDIQATPKNGTGPYTLTVAPASHPPFNMTVGDMSAINWTVSMSWASPFFISVADSDHNSWSYGPLHAGEGTTSSCLDASSSNKLPAIASGAGIGGLVLGLLVGGLASWLFLRRKQRDPRARHPSYADSDPFASPMLGAHDRGSYGSSQHLLPPLNMPGSRYQVEPFLLPQEDRESAAGPRSPGGGQSNVYVVHHDGGRAPVTVYHGDDTQVVELPPMYPAGEEGEAASHHGTSGSTRGASEASEMGLRMPSDHSRPPTQYSTHETYAEPPHVVETSALVSPPRRPGEFHKPRR
ncbi:hypothetical protein EV121DRAFT_195744 [Schizophyllum commune]